MFSLNRSGLVDVHFDKKRISMFPVPTNREYPETRDEAIKVLGESIQKIDEELRYMIGCVHFVKARFFRPTPKKALFYMLFGVSEILFSLKKALGLHSAQTSSEQDDLPF